MNEELKRLLTSRKFWGAFMGNVGLIIAGRVMPPESAALAIPYIGAFWIAAIGGQAISDAIKNKNEG